MHYECRNRDYMYTNNPCPKFGKWVRRRTVANNGNENCERCGERMRAIRPLSKPDSSKTLRRINTPSGLAGKSSVRKKSARKKGPRKLVISKR